jgi:hypothetical protein
VSARSRGSSIGGATPRFAQAVSAAALASPPLMSPGGLVGATLKAAGIASPDGTTNMMAAFTGMPTIMHHGSPVPRVRTFKEALALTPVLLAQAQAQAQGKTPGHAP